METSIWGALPMEVLERVVAFLPLPSLSRFRCVNKRLQAWIFSDKFFKLCEGLPLQKAGLFVCRDGETCRIEVSINEKILDFVAEYVQPYHKPNCSPSIYSAFGSLALASCGRWSDCDDVVLDLALRRCTRIPKVPLWHVESETPWCGIATPVDGDSTDFKVFVSEVCMSSWRLHLYEHIDGSWRSPCHYSHTHDLGYWQSCALFLGRMVVLLPRKTDDPGCPSHDLVTIDIEGVSKGFARSLQYIDDLIHPKLVTDGNRLFIAGWRHERVVVCEINRAMNECVEVLQVELSMHKRKEEFDFLENLAVYKDSFFFRLSDERAAIYDLRQKVWRDLRNVTSCEDREEFNLELAVEDYSGEASLFLDVSEN